MQIGIGLGLQAGSLLGGTRPPLLTDTFLRADTVAPSLGSPTALVGFGTSGTPWQMFGPAVGGAPGPAVGGNISSHQYACLAGQVVYPVQQLGGNVVRWGAEVNFVDGGGVTNFGAVAMLSSIGSNVILNAAHFVVTRVGARIEKIINGAAPVQIANIGFGGTFLPKASKFVCSFFIDKVTGAWTLRYAGRQITGTNPELLALIGPYFTAELFQTPGTDVDSLPRYNQLFAATDGQPTTFLENELIPDPSFSNPAKWSADPCWAVSGGVATKTAGTAGNVIPNPNIVPVVGGTYLVTYEIVSYTAGAFLVGMGGVNGTVRTALGVYSDELVGIVNSGGLTFFGQDIAAGVIDNLSCVRTA